MGGRERFIDVETAQQQLSNCRMKMSVHIRSDKSFFAQVQDTDEVNPDFEALLTYLKHNRGYDLTGYKRSSLMRRFDYRMQSINIDTYQNYLRYLQTDSEEYLTLLNGVLINVTSFFRDRDTWHYLATEIIPRIIASKQPNEPIRVWSAGCATGQESYSLLILLAEALGLEACLQRVQCFATDVNATALRQAVQGIYSQQKIVGIPSELLERYFEHTETGYVFHQKLRPAVIFSRHDLTQDEPIPRIDLLICRNVLMYFTPETQDSILTRFHFALQNTGFLCLGKAEASMKSRQIFHLVDFRQRVYAKGLSPDLADLADLVEPPSITRSSHWKQISDPLKVQTHFWQTAFESNAVAQIAVDLSGHVISANQQANLLFGLTLEDWDHSFYKLEPGKLIAAHTSVKTISHNHHPVILKDIEWKSARGIQYFDVTITPVLNTKHHILGVLLTFIDTTRCKQLVEESECKNAELAKVTETLRATELELAAAHQEIQIFNQDILDRN